LLDIATDAKEAAQAYKYVGRILRLGSSTCLVTVSTKKSIQRQIFELYYLLWLYSSCHSNDWYNNKWWTYEQTL